MSNAAPAPHSSPPAALNVAIRLANAETTARFLVADVRELRGLLVMLLDAATPAAQLALINQALTVADRALGKR